MTTFEILRKFLPAVSAGGKQPTRFEHDDYRLAAAALLVHAAVIDGTMSDLERARLHGLISQNFGLDEATADDLVAEAIRAECEAVDLYHFTSLINRSLDEDGRLRIVEMMWEIIYADGQATEFERNLMWRAAGPARHFLARAHRTWPGRRRPTPNRADVTVRLDVFSDSAWRAARAAAGSADRC